MVLGNALRQANRIIQITCFDQDVSGRAAALAPALNFQMTGPDGQADRRFEDRAGGNVARLLNIVEEIGCIGGV